MHEECGGPGAKPGFFGFEFFAICQLRHVHVRKDNRLSLLFHTESNESWAGPGKEADNPGLASNPGAVSEART